MKFLSITSLLRNILFELFRYELVLYCRLSFYKTKERRFCRFYFLSNSFFYFRLIRFLYLLILTSRRTLCWYLTTIWNFFFHSIWARCMFLVYFIFLMSLNNNWTLLNKPIKNLIFRWENWILRSSKIYKFIILNKIFSR